MLDLQIHLRDRSPEVVAAWRTAFAGVRNVEVSQGDIFAGPKADAIISPANSFGYMDGGIDGAYAQHFGPDMVQRLRVLIRAAWDGELPVGCAAIVETGDAAIPLLVSAPTMRVPADVSQTVNAYLAFRAALISIRELNRRRPGTVGSILCPGMCTYHGRMSPETSAKQMRFAHALVVEGNTALLDSPSKVLQSHATLLDNR